MPRFFPVHGSLHSLQSAPLNQLRKLSSLGAVATMPALPLTAAGEALPL
jgi:hypothetical protein